MGKVFPLYHHHISINIIITTLCPRFRLRAVHRVNAFHRSVNELATMMSLTHIDWECVECFDSMEACRQYIQHSELLQYQGKPLKFKWHPSRAGDGRRSANFVCKTHADCPFVVRGQQVEMGRFEVQRARGVAHATQPATLRLGCIVDQEQMRQVIKMVDSGAKPGRIMNNLMRAEMRRCDRLGIEPVKRTQGGLEGNALPNIVMLCRT